MEYREFSEQNNISLQGSTRGERYVYCARQHDYRGQIRGQMRGNICDDVGPKTRIEKFLKKFGAILPVIITEDDDNFIPSRAETYFGRWNEGSCGILKLLRTAETRLTDTWPDSVGAILPKCKAVSCVGLSAVFDVADR
jgi:hypothetical protein